MPLSTDPVWQALHRELPDCRPRHATGEQRNHVLGEWMEPVYCVSCGTPHGYATKDTAYFVYLCDDCEATHGGLPLVELPETLIRGRS